jgi:mannose-6-phosphate isomerase-like protein (cupin superfamily)
MSAITLRKAATTKTTDTGADSRPKLFVTRCILAPGAPLNPLVEGTDVLIVGMNNGELVNEKKSPQNHVNVSSGLVMLMPKEEPYLLRNIGKETLELLVIEVRK